jgi:alkylated DNA repair dioxygenase AlkB
MIGDLFAEPLVADLEYRGNFISADEERRLIAHLSGAELSPFRFQGWTGKRLTRTFGWRYDFDDRSFAPSEPIPDWLLPLRAKAADFAGVAPEEFVHTLLVRYDPGAGIGWHRDRPVFEKVVGVSLGSHAVLRFRKRRQGGFDRARLEVEPRSAYLLSGPARHEWEHSIAPGETLRFSVTFRTFSEKGRRAAAVR